MQTLTGPFTTQASAPSSGFCEVYDFYLKSAIATPWGNVSVLRLTDLPGGIAFFTPNLSPEPAFGTATNYQYWVIKRASIKGDANFTADKMQIVASNVTTDWAAMVASIEWRDTPVIIRKVPTTITGATADDCAILWSGMIDSAAIKEKTLTFECSSDLANLSITAPRENMHRNCRFHWADDQCTALRFLPANYKSKTVGAGSTTSNLVSADLNEDTAASSALGTDLIDSLADANITASSQGASLVNVAVTVYLGGSNATFTAAGNGLSKNDPITFGGTTPPGGITFGTTYYAYPLSLSVFAVSTTPNGPLKYCSSVGSGVTISTVGSLKAAAVKASTLGYWKLGASADWGTNTDGFWVIPDAQAGLANAALKPYVQFDFGAAVTLPHWRISNGLNVAIEEMARMLVFFSSPDAATWAHETYFELPPIGGVYYNLYLLNGTNARYWRICVRSRWAQTLKYTMLGKVSGYADSRNYWASGRITFSDTTTTIALQGVSRRILENYAGSLKCVTLPAAPVAGDTFTIERGCPRTWNACCTRRNWENFGGFLDLPYQSVVRD